MVRGRPDAGGPSIRLLHHITPGRRFHCRYLRWRDWLAELAGPKTAAGHARQYGPREAYRNAGTSINEDHRTPHCTVLPGKAGVLQDTCCEDVPTEHRPRQVRGGGFESAETAHEQLFMGVLQVWIRKSSAFRGSVLLGILGGTCVSHSVVTKQSKSHQNSDHNWSFSTSICPA